MRFALAATQEQSRGVELGSLGGEEKRPRAMPAAVHVCASVHEDPDGLGVSRHCRVAEWFVVVPVVRVRAVP